MSSNVTIEIAWAGLATNKTEAVKQVKAVLFVLRPKTSVFIAF
jgi:hypothetical protein